MSEGELDVLETQFVQEYFKNGYNARNAYLAIRPDVRKDWASAQGNKILRRPHVSRALEDKKLALSSKIDKTSLVVRAGRIIDKAEVAEQYSAALKGIELQGRFIGAFESGEGDEEKYVQFITKITGGNVTIIQGDDNRKVELVKTTD